VSRAAIARPAAKLNMAHGQACGSTAGAALPAPPSSEFDGESPASVGVPGFAVSELTMLENWLAASSLPVARTEITVEMVTTVDDPSDRVSVIVPS